MKVAEEDVLEALRQCYHPEAAVNIVDLGLIYGIAVTGGQVTIRMSMPTKDSPAQTWLSEEVKRRAEEVAGVETVGVEVVWEPRWSPQRMTDEARRKLHITSQE